MRDTMLQQAPVLALPYARQEQLVCASQPLRQHNIQEWTKLEVQLREYGTRRAVDALHTAVHERSFFSFQAYHGSGLVGQWIGLTGATH